MPMNPGAPAPLPPAGRLAVAGTGFARAFSDLMIFGYLPIQLHSAGEERLAVLALITAIPALVRFLSAGVWGALASRAGRLKPYLLVGLTGYLGVLGVLPSLPSTWISVLVVGLGSLPASAVGPLSKSYVSLLGRETLGRSLAGWLQAESLGWLVGGLAISLLGETVGAFRLLLTLAAAVVALEGALVLLTLPEVRPADSIPAHGASPVALLQVAALLRRPAVWVPMASFALLTVASEGTFTLYGVYLTGVLQGSEGLYGASITTATLLGLLAYRVLGRVSHRLRPEGLLPSAACAYTGTYLLMAAWKEPLAVAALFALPLYAFARVGVTWQVARKTTERERSAAMGFLDGGEALAVGVGSLASGVLADRLGFEAVFVIFAASALLVALFNGWFSRAARPPAVAAPAPAPGGAPSEPLRQPEAGRALGRNAPER